MELTDFRLYQDVATLKEIVATLWEQNADLKQRVEQLERKNAEDQGDN